jgi:outer membrane lipoprotein-sorting protein
MWHYRVSVLLVACALAGVESAPAQTPPPAAASALTADQVIAKNLEAKGGVELLKSTDTVRMTGEVTSPTGPFRMTISAKRPDRRRTDAERQGQKLIEAFDGANGWVKMGGMPAQMVPAGPGLDTARRQAEFDSGLINYKEQGQTVELVAKTPVDGAYHLRITAKDGAVTNYYIDAATGLERKTVMAVRGPGGAPIVLETRFSDYRKIDGRMVPFVVETLQDGKPLYKTQLEKIEFNVPIDDTFFRMPPRAPDPAP